jgi:hypothetical protein
MSQANRVHSTPPTNTPIDTTRRGFLGGTAAALTIGTAVNVAALAATRPAAAASDPIYAAIEAHRVAAADTNAAQSRMSDFEDEIQAKGRLRRDDRLEEERRRGEEIETAIEEAHHVEQVAAYALLDVRPTTMAGVIALLNYACEHDDATYGLGWPENIGCEGSLDTRTWQYFLIANVAEILPQLAVTS